MLIGCAWWRMPCNSIYHGGRDWKNCGSRLAQAKKVIEIPSEPTNWLW
jgi:hypothetical protein